MVKIDDSRVYHGPEVDEEQAYQPPFSDEAEQAVLGGLLIDPNGMLRLQGKVKSRYFFRPEHRAIFGAMETLFNLQSQLGPIPIDIITVAEALNDAHQLQSIGGRTYLNELALNILTTDNLEYYAEMLREKAACRALQKTCIDLHAKAVSADSQDIISQASVQILKIREDFACFTERTLDDQLDAALHELKQEEELGITPGINTGFNRLDGITGGFRPESMIILAARPKVGKTALALNFTAKILKNTKRPVLFFSLEMREEDLLKRMFQIWGGGAENARQEIGTMPLRIIKKGEITIDDIRAECLRSKLQLGEPALVIIDYLQLITPVNTGKNTTRNEQVGNISRKIKGLASELKAPIVALSQFNRLSTQQARPTADNLRDSGSIEQDCDACLILHRPDDSQADRIELDVNLNRYGQTGIVKMTFNTNKQQFTEVFQ